jgi:DNA ligase-1
MKVLSFSETCKGLEEVEAASGKLAKIDKFAEMISSKDVIETLNVFLFPEPSNVNDKILAPLNEARVVSVFGSNSLEEIILKLEAVKWRSRDELISFLQKFTPEEQKWVKAHLTRKFRLGASNNSFIKAVAQKFNLSKNFVKRGKNLGYSFDEIINMGEENREIRVKPFQKIKPQLADSKLKLGDDEEVIVEKKYDGIRCLAHKVDDTVKLISRRGKPLLFPEIETELMQIPGDFIIDGEILVNISGEDSAYNVTEMRLRDTVTQDIMEALPARYYVFDCLYSSWINKNNTVTLAWHDHKSTFLRKEALQNILFAGGFVSDKVLMVPFVKGQYGGDEVNSFIAEMLADEKCEGVIVKKVNEAYAFDKRKWKKIKRGSRKDTIDVICYSYETFETGKRVEKLGVSTFNIFVSDENNEHISLGKVGNGGTEEEWVEMKKAIDDGEVLVLEIRAEEITYLNNKYGLKFPRIIRIRHDKDPSEATTLERVKEILG